uniref:Uncharacterized protein n=1 Tax=Anguilla anguilla TaxID=7936 RepID=A0A0E9QPJ1_ANGAN
MGMRSGFRNETVFFSFVFFRFFSFF